MKNRVLSFSLLLPLVMAGSLSGQTTTFEASDGEAGDQFGSSTAASGDGLLVGAYYNTFGSFSGQGSAYYYGGLSGTTASVIQEDAVLTASDAASYDYFGNAVALDGNDALVGAYGKDSMYLYSNVINASGTVTESAKFTASTGSAYEGFGWALDASDGSAVVGAYNASVSGTATGAAYYFNGYTGATGSTNHETARLLASDGAAGDYFGAAVAMDGDTAVVGAYKQGTDAGAAYVYRGLSSASGDYTETLKLFSSDLANYQAFGQDVAIAGNAVLVGAPSTGVSPGSAYYFFDISSGTGTRTEDVKLTSSVGSGGDGFGSAVFITERGKNAVVGDNSGRLFFYDNDSLTNATAGTTQEDFWLKSRDGDFTKEAVNWDSNDDFNNSWDDTQVVTPVNPGGGAATVVKRLPSAENFTLKDDATTIVIDQLEMHSRKDWIIGVTTDNNRITLTGSLFDVTQAGQKVHVGSTSTADNNDLTIDGTSEFRATNVYIGVTGNTGNSIHLASGATLSVDSFRLTDGSSLFIEGDYTDISNLLTYLDTTVLQVWGGSWITMSSVNYTSLVNLSLSGGYTQVLALNAVPEPATVALIIGVAALGFALWRRRGAR